MGTEIDLHQHHLLIFSRISLPTPPHPPKEATSPALGTNMLSPCPSLSLGLIFNPVVPSFFLVWIFQSE